MFNSLQNWIYLQLYEVLWNSLKGTWRNFSRHEFLHGLGFWFFYFSRAWILIFGLDYLRKLDLTRLISRSSHHRSLSRSGCHRSPSRSDLHRSPSRSGLHRSTFTCYYFSVVVCILFVGLSLSAVCCLHFICGDLSVGCLLSAFYLRGFLCRLTMWFFSRLGLPSRAWIFIASLDFDC